MTYMMEKANLVAVNYANCPYSLDNERIFDNTEQRRRSMICQKMQRKVGQRETDLCCVDLYCIQCAKKGQSITFHRQSVTDGFLFDTLPRYASHV